MVSLISAKPSPWPVINIRMAICEYDGAELIVGENWTARRMETGQLVCRTCASAIAQGKLSRAAKLFPQPKASRSRVRQPVSDMTRHNRETVGEAKARAIAERKARVDRQMTPEVIAGLAKPWSEVNTTIDLKRKSDRELLRLMVAKRTA